MTILMTPASKAALAARAAARKMSIGEYVREKVEDDNELTPEQEAELAMLVAEVNAAIPKMNSTIDSMISTLRQTSEHIRDTLASLEGGQKK
ncbi:hypothetical protein [Sphingomonas sp.]